MVYNVNEDQCATTPILKGLYVWDGSKWQFVGQKPSSDVGYEIDNRPHGGPLAGTTQIYPYLTFGSAGTWMLENMRYIPADASITENNGSANATSKYYTYPNKKTLDPGVPTTWSASQGLLYTYSAATLGAQDGVDIDQGQGTAPTPIIQGICPLGWHIPSDAEWNQLEAEIYNKAYEYSYYQNGGSDAFNPTTWNVVWETGISTAGYGWCGSTNSKGHGLAILSPCEVSGSVNGITNGQSLSTAQGGFSALLTGLVFGSTSSDYGFLANFWSASTYPSTNGAWRRFLKQNEPRVFRDYGFRNYFFSVRCIRNAN